MKIFPSFYDNFKCKASACTDTCCTGWEIDVDDTTYDKYKAINSQFGEYILSNIAIDGDIKTINLTNDEKCRFLDCNGLCKIYENLGESFLCDICYEHPRFYYDYEDVTEIGLGLCCEQVCELLFDDNYDLKFVSDIKIDALTDCYAEYLIVREKIFEILEQSGSICNKFKKIFAVIDENFSKTDAEIFESVLNILRNTEPINSKWTNNIELLCENSFLFSLRKCDINDDYYSKFAAYVIYRHFISSAENDNIYGCVKLALTGIIFLYCNEQYILQSREFTKADLINTVKLWSQQIEYSCENTQYCLTIDV